MTMPKSAISESVKFYLNPRLHEVIDQRTALGWKKYGQSLDENVKTDDDKCVHLIQELLDAMQYVEWGGTHPFYKQTCMVMLGWMVNLLIGSFPDLTTSDFMWKEGYQE